MLRYRISHIGRDLFAGTLSKGHDGKADGAFGEGADDRGQLAAALTPTYLIVGHIALAEIPRK